jgi:predicted PurR-regulated permease PerM
MVILGSLVLIVASLYWAQKILIPLALAILLAFILSPAAMALQRRGLGRIPSVILVVLLALLVLVGVGSVLSYQVRSLAKELPSRRDQIAKKIGTLAEAGKGGWLEEVRTAVQEITHDVLRATGEDQKPENVPLPVQIRTSGYSQLREALEPAAEGLATAGMVLVLVTFILIRREDLRNRIVRLIGRGRLVVTTRAIDEAGQRISRYLLMQLAINAAFGATLATGLFLLRVPYPLAWGLMAGLLRFVPYVGTWLAALLLGAFSIAIFEGWMRPLGVMGLFVVAELLTFNVVEPLAFGHSTGISSVALLVAAAFWTWLWGPIGLVLSTPLTACLVVLGKYVPQMEFFSILLGDEPVLDAEVTYYQRLLARDHDEAIDLVEQHLHTHSLETVYDEVLLPALVWAKRDREAGDLTLEDEDFVIQATRDVLNDLVLPQQAQQSAGQPHAEKTSTGPQAVILGCPARDVEDELAMEMFEQLLAAEKCRVQRLSTQTLAGELIEHVEQTKPTLVCIASLPPGGLAVARYLCKRLRLQFPDLKIAVGRWGLTENVTRSAERLRTAGADVVATTLLESRSQILPMVRALAHVQGSDAKLELEAAALT